MDHDDFSDARRYTRNEVAAFLSISPSWIKDWITQRAVPVQQSGVKRGFWFTHADIRTIGAMLPALMNQRQAQARR